MYKTSKLLNSGDNGIVMEFGNSISEAINSKVRSMMMAIDNKNWNFIIEIIPTYRSLSIYYDPIKIEYDNLIKLLLDLEKKLDTIDIPAPNIIEIPVFYGNEYGEDLSSVASQNNLTEEEVIKIHTGRKYLIYMIGFTPGFPYLGGMDERIATPRLEKPRIKVEKGSVGIAGSQTGVYPLNSPGGWQIIGRTPLNLYDPLSDNPILLNTGDYIKFVSISKKEFENIHDKYNRKGVESNC